MCKGADGVIIERLHGHNQELLVSVQAHLVRACAVRVCGMCVCGGGGYVCVCI